MPGPYNYVVFRDKPNSGSYHAVRTRDNAVIKVSDVPEQVLQAALDQPLLEFSDNGFGAGDIYVCSGLYSFSSAFAGLLVHSFTRVTLDATAILEVPSGYGGPVIQLLANSTTSLVDSVFDGGRIRESKAGGIKGQWTAFTLQSTATGGPDHGVIFCKLTNTVVIDAGIGIAIYATGDNSSFVNSNKLEFLRFYAPRVSVDFKVFNGYVLGEEDGGISYNNFVDVQFEIDSKVFGAGIQNVAGVGNTFTSVNVWDAGPMKTVMTIGALADRTLIVGGTLGGESLHDPAVIQNGGRDTRVVN
jgi:hypothetical protein